MKRLKYQRKRKDLNSGSASVFFFFLDHDSFLAEGKINYSLL